MASTGSKLVAIVTGASRGIGAAAAIRLAKNNVRVLITARGEHGLNKVAEQIRNNGGECEVVCGDISKPEICEQVVSRALSQYGRIDTVIHNAGVINPISFVHSLNLTEFEESFNINFFSAVCLTKLTLPHVKKQQGRYIFVGTGADGIAGWSLYCASKAAMLQFSKCLAVEEPDITSVCIAPGIYETEMQAKIRADGLVGMTKDSHAFFVGLHENHELLSPEVGGELLTVLGLHTPREWSGEFLSNTEPRVVNLVKQYGRL